MDKILVVGASPELQSRLLPILHNGYGIRWEETPAKALPCIATDHFALLVLCEGDGPSATRELLSAIHQSVDPYLPVIVLACNSQPDHAFEVMRAGAFDLLPFDADREMLNLKIWRALEQHELINRFRGLQQGVLDQQHRFIFASDAMKSVNFELSRLASLDYDLLLSGETGVGKDLLASMIHVRSPRKAKVFVPIPLRSLNESLIESELFGHERGAFSSATSSKMGRFEAANGGTIYIPEISCLTEAVQLKLLYFMQYKRISRVGQDPHKPEVNLDVRLIFATNDDLESLVESGRIREDFYHRIAGVTLRIPPLRERKGDIVPLAEYFLETFTGAPRGTRYDFSLEALELLHSYSWPGNVRELENAIKSAVAYANGPLLGLQEFAHAIHLNRKHRTPLRPEPPEEKLPLDFHEADALFKKKYFTQLMTAANRSVSRAAELSGLTPQWVRKMVKMLGIGNSLSLVAFSGELLETILS